MLFFRSEEHLQKWAQYDPSNKGGIISIPDMLKLVSIDYCIRRMDQDYISHIREYEVELIEGLVSKFTW